jgi:hypothetical protein
MLLISCSTKKNEQRSEVIQEVDQTFPYQPAYPLVKGCENATSSSCLENSISRSIINEANKRKVILKADTLNIGVKFKPNGKLEIIRNISNNTDLKKLAVDAISSMKILAPGFSKRENRYVTHTNVWFIIFKDNQFVNPSNY